MSVFRKATVGLAIAVSLTALAGAANAQGYTGQFATFTKNVSTNAIITFTGGAGGSLSFTPDPMLGTRAEFDDTVYNQLDFGATMSFGPLTGAVMGIDQYHWSFTGNFGFTILDSLANPLLTATFTKAELNTAGGNQSGGILSLSNVVYTGGDYLLFVQSDWPDTSNTGFFDFSLSGINDNGKLGPNSTTGAFTVGYNSGGPTGNVQGGFTGNMNITAAVPEPGEWAAMGILASGLGGLMVRARRRMVA